MTVKSFSKYFLFIIIALFSVNLYAQENETENLYENCNVLLGVGTSYHVFSDDDYFRKGTGLFGDDDEITGAAGLYFNAELLLNDTFSLSLPVGLSAGYRIQTMEGGYEYSTIGGYTVERKVQIVDNIGYVNVFVPIDDEKYWLIGGSVGLGASNYKVTWDGDNPAYVDTEESSSGTIVPLSIFLDWGADGFGGRAGYTYVMSDYADINGETPKGDGNRFFIELRYGI